MSDWICLADLAQYGLDLDFCVGKPGAYRPEGHGRLPVKFEGHYDWHAREYNMLALKGDFRGRIGNLPHTTHKLFVKVDLMDILS